MTPEEWAQEVAVVWASIDEVEEPSLLATIDRMPELAPGEDGSGVFERASPDDSTGHSDLAAPLYQAALSPGMTGERPASRDDSNGRLASQPR